MIVPYLKNSNTKINNFTIWGANVNCDGLKIFN